jgi:predicted membrane channel-forming protein YqfA (hemolysin III family)
VRALPLLVAGYLAEVVVLVNWVLVVRERRSRWFAVHVLAMAAVIVGWLTVSQGLAAVVNGAWLVLSALWYTAGARLSHRRQP